MSSLPPSSSDISLNPEGDRPAGEMASKAIHSGGVGTQGIATQGGEAELDLGQELQAIEASLQALKTRYHEVQAAQYQKAELGEQRDRLDPQAPTFKAELEAIDRQLGELEFTLESRLFSWSGVREYFWQAVRFGGLGLVIGWTLAYGVLKQPNPNPTTPLERQEILK
ncbi:hypothetical protein ACN4EG_10465 [Alkalinema pantanalense CENA528]|uniref:hypothetical protein n=1 Tax=Alkalinema pantanalense TaxID=1620705 RepID=UPI003D6E481B